MGSKNITMFHYILKVDKKNSPGSYPCPYDEIYYILENQAVITPGNHNGKQYEVLMWLRN